MRGCCIFAGSSHPRLVEAICERVGQRPSEVELRKFSNGETSVTIKCSVRDQDVFIVQSGSSEINDNVVEMLIMISACKGGSAKSITGQAVMPYFPYSRQSKQKSHRGAITARMLANLMKVAGVDHVITIDLHASQMQGFFRCPVDNLLAEPILAKWIKHNIPDWQNSVVVSKNPGGTKRVTSMADALKLSFGIMTTDRRRPYGPPSLYGSAIFEPIGTDGTVDPATLAAEADLQQTLNPDRPKEVDFAHRHARCNGESSPSKAASPQKSHHATGNRFRGVNGGVEMPPSPLGRTLGPGSEASEADDERPTRRERGNTTASSIRLDDDDGFEEADGDETDESPRDIITGRLVHGHIVDDDDDERPSPSHSSQSLTNLGQRSSHEDDSPDHMVQSFISTTSSRMQAPRQGLGGTGDAAASDEEEEEALQNPDGEATVTLVGNVRGKPVLIIDDMIDKAGSWIAAAETAVKRGGATGVYCMATHGLFGGESLRELDRCEEIKAIVVTNAFPIPEEKTRGIRKLMVLDVSGLLAEAIRRNHHGESISQLYQLLD